MTAYHYKMQDVVISIIFGGTTVVVGASQGGEVVTSFDVHEVRGQDSVLRQAKWVNNISIRVRLQYAKFDGAVIGALLGTTEADKDFANVLKTGFTHAYITGGSYANPTFDVRGVVPSDTSAKEFGIRVPGVLFENLALPIPLDGALMPSLEGNGDAIHVHYPTT